MGKAIFEHTPFVQSYVNANNDKSLFILKSNSLAKHI